MPRHWNWIVAILALTAIVVHLVLRFALHSSEAAANWPLWIALAIGGLPYVMLLANKALHGEFGSDLLAAISIVTSVFLGEYLAGSFVVLMLSGGEALEEYAVESASSVLKALAKRMPQIAHRQSNERMIDVPLNEVAVNDELIVLPHEICPVDGVVVVGHGAMDEAYLTGEPYQITKSVGSDVLSGAINGESALTIRATQKPADSRYAKIMHVMRDSQQNRPRMRRLGDQLGALYTPLALAIAGVAWWASGEPRRFLAVLVTATPCPLLIGIPVAIIGTISLAARRGIIVRDPAILERIGQCRTMIFDKTGTLTYGEPHLTEEILSQELLSENPPTLNADQVLQLAASLEQYSRHPLSAPVLEVARKRKLMLLPAQNLQELPGTGLVGNIAGHEVRITSRKLLMKSQPDVLEKLPSVSGGLECLVVIDGRYAATYRFRDEPRRDGASFIEHLGPRHKINRLMIVSGDRETEVRYLADQVGIKEVFASKSPEEKLAIVRDETKRASTLYLGDGINDAPALLAASVGVAMGQRSDVTSEAAGAVILDTSLSKVDELMHIGHRMHTIAMQTAIGGISLSVGGMLLAAFGLLAPVAGAVFQELIDVAAVMNSLRAAWPPKVLTDYEK